jgi:hypothetical protein
LESEEGEQVQVQPFEWLVGSCEHHVQANFMLGKSQ